MLVCADRLEPGTARIAESWVVTGGTGRFDHYTGEGISDEIYTFHGLTRSVHARLTGDIRMG